MQQLTLTSIESDESGKEHRELKKERLDVDGHECVSCGSSDDLQIHHVVPKSAGGVDEISNLRTLCPDCHSRSHDNQIGFINANHTHYSIEETRWLPSVDTVQHLVSNTHHPLRKALIMLIAKTAIGSGEIINLELGDLYLRDGASLGTSEIKRPKRPFMLIEANDSRPGFSERLCDTYIPLDRETVRCLKRWLMIRPDSGGNKLFLYTSGRDWGKSLTRRSLRRHVEKEATRLGVYETNGGENLNPTALVQFFRNRFNGQPAVRSYIDGKKKEKPMPLSKLATDYRENIFKLDTEAKV